VDALFRLFDFTPLAGRVNLEFLTSGKVLVARSPAGPGLTVYDEGRNPRVELEVTGASGYETRGGLEYPADGLRVVRLWREAASGASEELDLRQEPVRLPVRRRFLDESSAE
jgi:hypothetical protein